MSGQDNKLVFEGLLDALLEDVSGHLRIDCAQRVIEKVDVGF